MTGYDILVNSAINGLQSMLHALQLLGAMDGNRDDMIGAITPVTPDRYRLRSSGLAIGTPPESVKDAGRGEARRGRSALDEPDANGLITNKRRSKRLEARSILPPTPESLPRSPRRSTPSARTGSTPNRPRGRKRIKLQDDVVSPLKSKAKIVIGRTEEDVVEPIRKIHLIQGQSHDLSEV